VHTCFRIAAISSARLCCGPAGGGAGAASAAAGAGACPIDVISAELNRQRFALKNFGASAYEKNNKNQGKQRGKVKTNKPREQRHRGVGPALLTALHCAPGTAGA
jgi:hypothetical protein